MEEAKFIHWLFFHFKLEKRKELLEVLKEWKKLYEDKKINSGYSIWLVELGLDNNMMVLTEYAKDGADFLYNNERKFCVSTKQKKMLFGQRWLRFLLSVEQKFGNLRPDLSYTKK